MLFPLISVIVRLFLPPTDGTGALASTPADAAVEADDGKEQNQKNDD